MALLNRAISQSDRNIKATMKIHDNLTKAMETTMDVVSEIKHYDCGMNGETTNELKSLMLEYLKMEQEMNSFNEAVAQTMNEIEQLDEETDVPKLHDILSGKLDENHPDHVSYDALRKHERYVELVNRLTPSDKTPNDAEDRDDDCDIAMTQEEINTKCPITHQIMSEPMRNRHCGHTYDRSGILQLIKNRRNKAMCPMGGCCNKKPVREADLEDHHELRRYIESQQRVL